MIKTKVTSNVSFTKLLNNLPKILDKTLNNVAKDSADLSKSNIDNESGNNVPFKSLDELTINVRKRGVYWEMQHNVRRRGKTKIVIPIHIKKGLANIGGNKPLKYTGNLYNSIKAKKNVLTIEGYGGLHNDGYEIQGHSKKISIPARPFIETIVGEDTKDKFLEDLEKNLKK